MKKKQDKKIKIFVSHRIDVESDIVNNPLYIDVRCGAALDKQENLKMLGDNTGYNISDKKDYYSEFTVQYWAWKNVEADYYGLCHYRRYLSFSNKYFDCQEPHMFAVEPYITKRALRKYGLLNIYKMKKEIKKYDVITSLDYPVNALPFYPKARNEYEVWNNHPEYLLGREEIELLLEIIKHKFPMFYETALESMQVETHKGFNCFIMKKDLFFQMCEFEFSVLFEIEKQLDFNKYTGKSIRTMGYLGEILYDIFMLWLKKQNKYKIKETQIILFRDTKKVKWGQIKMLNDNIKQAIKKLLPTYKATLRLEEQIISMQKQINQLQQGISKIETMNNLIFWLQEPKYKQNLDDIKRIFWQSFPKASGDLALIQQGNIKLLERFKLICDKLNIKFWLHGGSLVGAVRHNGFVPWDDDIDIGMMRDDFSKVSKYLAKSEHYIIYEFYYTNLACRSYRFYRKDLSSNFFIDIFLYDNYEKKYDDILDDWKHMILSKTGVQVQWKQYIKNKNMEVFNNIKLDDNIETKKYIDKLIDRYVDRYKSNKKSEYIAWGIDNNFENHTKYAFNNGRIFNYDDIFPLNESIFENMYYNIPSNYEKYIFKEYGIDYLEVPNDINISKHVNKYFKDTDIKTIYDELIKSENEIEEI